mgnify:CR=1 FL=1
MPRVNKVPTKVRKSAGERIKRWKRTYKKGAPMCVMVETDV